MRIRTAERGGVRQTSGSRCRRSRRNPNRRSGRSSPAICSVYTQCRHSATRITGQPTGSTQRRSGASSRRWMRRWQQTRSQRRTRRRSNGSSALWKKRGAPSPRRRRRERRGSRRIPSELRRECRTKSERLSSLRKELLLPKEKRIAKFFLQTTSC